MSVAFTRLALGVCMVLAGIAMSSKSWADPLAIRGTISQAAWQAYCARFVDPAGRVVDDANGGISHTEGQGYGMLLALAADDRAGFELIWTFTQTEMLLRADGLAVWRWLPTQPHVPDSNNATDGDLLLAYALALAGKAWEDPTYTAAATRLATAIGNSTIVKHAGQTLLLPGVDGFSAAGRPDGPVINLSYWVFEALPVMQELAPDADWQRLFKSGTDLIAKLRFGSFNLPPDWISMHDRVAAPASGFDPIFGYNGIRIPFYLVRAGIDDASLYAPYAAAWAGGTTNGIPLVNVETSKVTEMLIEPGYRMLPALMDCALNDKPIPTDLRSFTPTHYYPSTLYLLSISYLAERHPECL